MYLRFTIYPVLERKIILCGYAFCILDLSIHSYIVQCTKYVVSYLYSSMIYNFAHCT